MDSGDEITTRAQAHIAELEALLYSRAGSAPRAEPNITPAETRIENLDLRSMTTKKLTYATASKLCFAAVIWRPLTF